MAQFLKNGNTFRAVNEEMLDLHNTLPPGNYTIKQDQFKNFYFEKVDSFEFSHKIYGDTIRNADRMMQTFHDRPNSTGILLTGEKGSGKTLLAKKLAVKCAEQGIPTIIINTNWHGDTFNALIQSINQPCMILFDEFEKVYDSREQEAILTLLDGVFPSKKLFVLTCNNKWRVDEHMKNRPGRIFYMLDFRGLDIKFITEYCNENLNDQNQVENVRRASAMFPEFNFDLLKALVEEMNRYGESAHDALKLLNAKPQHSTDGRYKVTLKVSGKAIPENETSPREWHGNPLSSEKFNIRRVPANDNDDDDDYDENDTVPGNTVESALAGTHIRIGGDRNAFHFTCDHLKKVDADNGTLSYTNKDGATVIFTKIRKEMNYYAF